MMKSVRPLGIAAIAALSLTFSAGANATLIAHYTFDGALTADSSGNGRTLTNGAGGPSSVAGQFGNAADFAGGAFLFSADSAFNIGTGNFAISMWYQAAQSGFSPLVGKDSSNLDTGYATFHDGINVSGGLGDTTGGVVATARPGDDTTVFHHMVVQAVGTTLELYLDGVLAATDLAVTGSDTLGSAFAIGTRNISLGGGENNDGASQKMNGLLDEIYVFDNALTATQISNLEQFNSLDAPVLILPEPGTLALLGLGLFGIGFTRRRRG